MKFTYRVYMMLRLLLAALTPVTATWFSYLGTLSSRAVWFPLYAVSLLVLVEELFALLMMGKAYFSGFFAVPSEVELPATVFEGDRTFVEVLCAVSAGVLGIAFSEATLASRFAAKGSLGLSVLLSFLYLNLQGASVLNDIEVRGQHIVRLRKDHSTGLLILRNLVYWTFIYGLAYAILGPR